MFIFFLQRKKTNQKNAAKGEGFIRGKANMPLPLSFQHPLPLETLTYFFRASKKQAIKPPSVAPATAREKRVLVYLSGKAIPFARTRLCSQREIKKSERLATCSDKLLAHKGREKWARNLVCFEGQS